MSRASRLDLLFVHRAILFCRDLTDAHKTIAGAIVAHFNEETGQCDPGIDRIVHLLGLNRATVFRALAAVERAGIIVRTSYDGKSHRNAYSPNWERCRILAREANSRTSATQT